MPSSTSKSIPTSWVQTIMVPLPTRAAPANQLHLSHPAFSNTAASAAELTSRPRRPSTGLYLALQSHQRKSPGAYFSARAPNDEKHIESFDVAHQWMTMMLDDKLYAAPITDNPQRILDIGTGTGLWAIDMADQFPSATVIGTDISPTQPAWVPPNLSFQIDDAQLDWTFEPNSFDFIHVRFMYGAIDDWPKLYRQMYRCLKPGGWFQHMEPDIAARCGNPKAVEGNKVWKQWTQLFYDAGDKLGRTFRLSDIGMEKAARDAGFDGITYRIFNIPYGNWPKDKGLKQLGQYAGLYLDLSLDGFALLPIGEVLGWSFEEVEVLVAKMRAVVRNPNNWVNSDMHMVYGRKPGGPVDTISTPEGAAA